MVEKTGNPSLPIEITPTEDTFKTPNIETIVLGDLTWINIEKPTRVETEYLAKHFPFHQLDLDDTLSRVQRPKIDEYPDYLFIVLHFPVWQKEAQIASATQISIFVSKNYVVTLHNGDIRQLRELFQNCKANEINRQENMTRGSAFLVYRIIDILVDRCFIILDRILGWLDSVENAVFDENVETAVEIARLRRDIIAQRRIIWPLRTVIGELATKLHRYMTTDLDVYFGDVMDHLNKIWDTMDECKEIVEIYKDTDYVLSNERLGKIMRVLTVLSTVAIPAAIISSIYGMNVRLPGDVDSPHGLKTLVVLGIIMLLSSVFMLVFFKRKRWI
ncbi:MAG: magnesium transporter CorA family protein [Dehalococcoidales bacterium]|nr:magnesium transporter CorA family protein [Dehalococcoidales bacterium]